MNENKLKTIKNWSSLQTIYDVRLFLNFCFYYCRYIENFVIICDFLYDLIKKQKSQIQICDYNFYDSKCFRINQEHYVFRQNFCSIRYFFIFHHRNKYLVFWMKNDVLLNKIKRYWMFDCFWKQKNFICWTKLFYS